MNRTKKRTLASRLALGAIAWIGLWAVGLLLVFNILLSSVLAAQVDASLLARADAVAATVQIRDGRLVVARGDDAGLDVGTSIYLGESLLEGTSLKPELQTELVQHGRTTTDREVPGPVRYLAKPIMSHGRQVGTIVVSSAVGSRARTERIVAGASVLFVVLLLGFTYPAVRATVGRAMRPVRVMSDQAAAWSDKDIDRRFDPDVGPLELRRLALTLNALLERISATLRHERYFTAELSHELRTPLAHLHAEVDLLTTSATDPSNPEPVAEQDLAGLMTSIRRLEGLVESALTPARIEQGGTPWLGLMDDVLADLPRPAAPPSSLTGPTSTGPTLIVPQATGVVLAVETDVARRALLPVLENAWRYAVNEVRIDVVTRDGMARLTVSDDGGRLDSTLAEAIFAPGFRGDPADGYPGAGLGLALARRICRAAGGEATAESGPGRTAITLQFPCLRE